MQISVPPLLLSSLGSWFHELFAAGARGRRLSRVHRRVQDETRRRSGGKSDVTDSIRERERRLRAQSDDSCLLVLQERSPCRCLICWLLNWSNSLRCCFSFFFSSFGSGTELERLSGRLEDAALISSLYLPSFLPCFLVWVPSSAAALVPPSSVFTGSQPAVSFHPSDVTPTWANREFGASTKPKPAEWH